MQDQEAALAERREAELEFVAAAYDPEEAWVERTNSTTSRTDDDPPPAGATASSTTRRDDYQQHASSSVGVILNCVHRRLRAAGVLTGKWGDCDSRDEDGATFRLELQLPVDYPDSALVVSGHVEHVVQQHAGGNAFLLKAAHNSLPDLLRTCREAAAEQPGEESILSVFTRAEEWILEWTEEQRASYSNSRRSRDVDEKRLDSSTPSAKLVLARNLIYSHHIVSPTKRADMKALASELNLTGYLKILWPGIILIEGEERDCHEFYDRIRRWAWQYLVLRGETRQELSAAAATNIDAHRKFDAFREVDSMSVVASHCRTVGLEALFLTSMKVYDSTDSNGKEDTAAASDSDGLYGALIHVDHMNDGKGYRKWLRTACNQTDVFLLLKQCYPNQDFTKRPLIVVGLIGSRTGVSTVLKKWRTSRVDVDSQGKRCLERMLTVLVEGTVDEIDTIITVSDMDWDKANSDSALNTTKEKLLELIQSIGIGTWVQAVSNL